MEGCSVEGTPGPGWQVDRPRQWLAVTVFRFDFRQLDQIQEDMQMTESAANTSRSPKTLGKRRQPALAVRLGAEASRALDRLAEDEAVSKTEILRRAVLDAEQRHGERRHASQLDSLREMAAYQGTRLEALVAIVRQVEIDLKGRLETQAETIRSTEQLSGIAAMRLQAIVEESSNPRIRERAAQLIAQLSA
jgi:hypothetical protein